MSNPSGTLDGTVLEATLRAVQQNGGGAGDESDSEHGDEPEELASTKPQQFTAYRSGSSIHTFSRAPATALVYDADREQILAISGQGEVVVRASSDLTILESWQITAAEGTPIQVSAAALAGDDLIIGCVCGMIQRWSVTSRTLTATWDDHKGKISCLSIVNTDLYSTSHDGYFLVRSLLSSVIVHSFITCTCPLVTMAIERPGIVYIGSWDGQVKRLDLDAHACTLVLKASASKESPIRALALTSSPAPPTKRKKKNQPEAIDTTPLVFVAHGHGEIKSWDMRTGKVIIDQYMGCGDVINTLQVIRGRLYAGGDDRCIRIFDIFNGICIDTLTGHENGVTSMTVIGDSLCTTGYDGQWRQYGLGHIETAIANKLTKLEEGKRLAYEAYLKSKKTGKKKRRSKKSAKGKGSKKKSSKKKKSKEEKNTSSDISAAVAAASAAIGISAAELQQADTKVLSSKGKTSPSSKKKKSKSSKKKKKGNKDPVISQVKASMANMSINDQPPAV